jgi:pyruvate dehydrogenase E2 component (dihydrolipoamide acetyltransferase)
MITYVAVPQYFENMEEATIGAWLKKEGEPVAKGDALCELITEKTTFELEAEGEGFLRLILAPEKAIVPVGFTLALIGGEDEVLPDIEAENTALKELKKDVEDVGEAALKVPSLSVPSAGTPSTVSPSAVSPSAVSPSASAPPPSAAGSRVRATPAARRAARDRGLNLEEVAAKFPGKVLSEEDVANYQG